MKKSDNYSFYGGAQSIYISSSKLIPLRGGQKVKDRFPMIVPCKVIPPVIQRILATYRYFSSVTSLECNDYDSIGKMKENKKE